MLSAHANGHNWLADNSIRNASKFIEYTYRLHFQLPRRVNVWAEEVEKNERERDAFNWFWFWLLSLAIVGSLFCSCCCCCCCNDIKEEEEAKKTIWLWSEKIFIQIYTHAHTLHVCRCLSFTLFIYRRLIGLNVVFAQTLTYSRRVRVRESATWESPSVTLVVASTVSLTGNLIPFRVLLAPQLSVAPFAHVRTR